MKDSRRAQRAWYELASVTALALSACTVLGAQAALAGDPPDPGAQPSHPKKAAVATDAGDDEEPPIADTDWTIGAGIGFAGVTFIGGGLGAATRPASRVLVERQVIGPLSFLMRGGAGVSSVTDYGSDSLGFAVDGAVGVRVAFTSPEIVAVSMFGLVGGSYDRGAPDPYTDIRGRGVYGEIGFSIDREIVPGFGARLSTTVARAGYGWQQTSSDYGIEAYAFSSSATSFALGLSPTAELRWSF